VAPEWDDIPSLPKAGSFKTWTSQSVGPKRQLQWTKGRQGYRRAGINAILRRFEQINSSDTRAEALDLYREGQRRRTSHRQAQMHAVIQELQASLELIPDVRET